MKFKGHTPDIPEQEEEQAVRELRSVASVFEQQMNRPADSYWSNLLVRTNKRIDDQTSGKAISLSWAARVAIPGVVAIIAFFIALHYYVPDSARPSTIVGPILASLNEQELDSLIVTGDLYRTVVSDPVVGNRLFDVAADQASDYLLSLGRESAVLEAFSDNQVDELLAVLSSPTN